VHQTNAGEAALVHRGRHAFGETQIGTTEQPAQVFVPGAVQ
jgi:hypothetical protein